MPNRIAFLAAACCLGISSAPGQELGEPDPSKLYLFYLHGRIIEDAGPRPTHEVWGLYDYPAVLDALGSRGAVVISEQRPKDTDVERYATKVEAQIDALIEAGVPESQIGVVGFSKGGTIATLVSARTVERASSVRYVLLGACVDWLSDYPRLSLKGDVLLIREASDALTTSCKSLSDYAHDLASYSEITIETGAEHGAFYLPREEWLAPTLLWIHGD